MVSPEAEQDGLDGGARRPRAGSSRRRPTSSSATRPRCSTRSTPLDLEVAATPAGGLRPPGTPATTPRSVDPVVSLVAAGGAGRAVAVLQHGWCLVLSLEVDPAHRRRGIASALVRAWAQLAGARHLYLQVERGNDPGHALYAKAGFARSHGYHYRRGASPSRAAPWSAQGQVVLDEREAERALLEHLAVRLPPLALVEAPRAQVLGPGVPSRIRV